MVVFEGALSVGSATTVTVTTLEYAAQLPKLAFLTYCVVVVSVPGSKVNPVAPLILEKPDGGVPQPDVQLIH